MRKCLVLTTTAIMFAALMTPSAFAQRDASAKARGDMSGFWSSRNMRSTNRAYIRSVQPATESYRSFSYVPAPQALAAGDEAVVTDNDTKMMRGSDVVAAVPNGTKFTVTKVINGWLGAVIEIDGKSANGWIRNSDAALAMTVGDAVQSPAGNMQTPAVAAQPQAVQEYRSFSYEPAPASSRPSSTIKKRPWMYSKGDPRRYDQ